MKVAKALAPGARKPYPEMRPGKESIIPEGTQEEKEGPCELSQTSWYRK